MLFWLDSNIPRAPNRVGHVLCELGSNLVGGGERRDKNSFIQIRDQCAKKDGRSEAGRGGMRVGERGGWGVRGRDW